MIKKNHLSSICFIRPISDSSSFLFLLLIYELVIFFSHSKTSTFSGIIATSASKIIQESYMYIMYCRFNIKAAKIYILPKSTLALIFFSPSLFFIIFQNLFMKYPNKLNGMTTGLRCRYSSSRFNLWFFQIRSTCSKQLLKVFLKILLV